MSDYTMAIEPPASMRLRHRGEYKTVTNHVEAFVPNGKSLGVVIVAAMPFETPGWMKDIADL
jgi:hypothetical protein